jgi:starch synthase (maltosyl-transferring)
VLVVVNLDAANAQEDTLGLDLKALGVAADRQFEAHDELSDATYIWHGPNPYVRLSPETPAHILHIREVS